MVKYTCSQMVLIALVLPLWTGAQMRSEYLDQHLNRVESPGEIYFIREASTGASGLWDVEVKYQFGGTKMKGTYSDEHLETEHGYFEYFYANGIKESCGHFEHGYKVGRWKRWDLEGAPKTDRLYPETAPKNQVASVIPADFPGGDESLTLFLETHLRYPAEASRIGARGIVYVAFTIGVDGKISDPEVVQGVNYYLDREALRLVEAMPRWHPALRNGNKVESSFVLPVRFDAGDAARR